MNPADAARSSLLPPDWNPVGLPVEALDLQYNARAAVPEHPEHLQAYAALSAQARAALPCVLDVAYGDHPRARLDIFPAPSAHAPVFCYIHGGYWRALSKDDSAFMAPVLQQAGATVVVIDYPLAPEVGLAEIVWHCRQALAWVWRHIGQYHGDPARVHVSGSSAGGHLTGMLLAPGWQAAMGVPDDVVHSASPVSGLFDLRPLVPTHINAWMLLDEGGAAELSPQGLLPAYRCPLLVACGGLESAEFKRQSQDYAAAWRAGGGDVHMLEVPGRHHFDIVLGWCHTDDPLTQGVLRLMDLATPAAG